MKRREYYQDSDELWYLILQHLAAEDAWHFTSEAVDWRARRYSGLGKLKPYR